MTLTCRPGRTALMPRSSASRVRSTSAPRLLVDVAGEEGGVGVAVDAVEVGGDVDVDDVAVLDHPAVRDAVADHLVDAGAEALGEAAVAERRGVRAVVAEELVADPVELVGRHARGDVGAHQLAGLRGQPARDPHPRDRLLVLDLAAGERGRARAGRRTRDGGSGRARGVGATRCRGRQVLREACGECSFRDMSDTAAEYWFCVKHHRVEGRRTVPARRPARPLRHRGGGGSGAREGRGAQRGVGHRPEVERRPRGLSA